MNEGRELASWRQIRVTTCRTTAKNRTLLDESFLVCLVSTRYLQQDRLKPFFASKLHRWHAVF